MMEIKACNNCKYSSHLRGHGGVILYCTKNGKLVKDFGSCRGWKEN